MKAHAAEARTVVKQALEILTPAMPVRMEDGNNMLTHWTKKIIVEEGHTLAQLVHMLQLLVRHFKVIVKRTVFLTIITYIYTFLLIIMFMTVFFFFLVCFRHS